MFRRRKQREKVWKDQGIKVVDSNIITSFWRLSKAPIHLIEEKSIKDNGKLFIAENLGTATLFVQDPHVFKDIFSKDFHIFFNRRVSNLNY